MPNVAFKRKELTAKLPLIELVRDCIAGEPVIKARRQKYLPIPNADSQRQLGEGTGVKDDRYQAYLTRANFYNVTGRTLQGLIGQVFHKDPSTEFPSEIEFFKGDVDGSGMSISQQAKSTLADVLAVGRGGLLADFPPIPEGEVVTLADIQSRRVRPRVIFIDAERIINWRTENYGGETFLSMLTIAESKVVSDDGFEFKTEPRWRVYRIENGAVTVTIWKKNENRTSAGPQEDYIVDPDGGGPFALKDNAGRPFIRIPFEFVGAENNDPSFDESPLAPIALINVAHYRNSADLEESSFLTGQPTLVLSGVQEAWADKYLKGGVQLGSRGGILLNQGANGQLLQAEPNNLPKELMKHKEEQMKALGAKLIEPGQIKGTATEAAIEEASESSVLSSAAKNVSTAYERAIFHASKWIGDFNE